MGLQFVEAVLLDRHVLVYGLLEDGNDLVELFPLPDEVLLHQRVLSADYGGK
jgi:hypothetical protein